MAFRGKAPDDDDDDDFYSSKGGGETQKLLMREQDSTISMLANRCTPPLEPSTSWDPMPRSPAGARCGPNAALPGTPCHALLQVAPLLEPSTAWDPMPRSPAGGAAARTQHFLGSYATLTCLALATSAWLAPSG